MKKKIIGFFICMLLIGTLIPLTSAITTTTSSQQNTLAPGHMKKTFFIGRFTVLSLKLPLVEKNIVGWVIGNGEIHRYRGSIPDITGSFQGLIKSPFLILSFETNPF